jgi:hypothetical protein
LKTDGTSKKQPGRSPKNVHQSQSR